MIKLKPGQMEQINAALMAKFQSKVYHYLDDLQADRNQTMGKPLSRQQLTDFIHNGITAAQSYRLTGEQDIVRFLEIVLFGFGGFTDAFKIAKNLDVLNDPHHCADDKLNFLQQSATASNADLPPKQHQ